MARWSAADIPSQKGRSAVVTGTGGLGYETALALARAGGEVVIAGRNPEKGANAVARILREEPLANVTFKQVDLGNLRSIADLGERLRDQRQRLDLLVNNAGVMTPPSRQETQDGFEQQLGANYLGHFALTAHLLPLLRNGQDPRVVTLSSVAARQGAIDFDDLNAAKAYKTMAAYSQSKLACLMFAFELQRRSEAGQWGVTSIAAHPGIARTDLLHNAPGRWSGAGLARSLLWFLFQPAARGALPTLFAATSREAKPGGYYGPDRLGETRGHPAPARIPPQALDGAAAQRLWRYSEALTGAPFG
ncbi:NAD(P)-dependent dehydrogenase (short-subunit alcohol dehydrogenase family) [Methylopila capsulata]|uniref:Dehydrogenase n=1 Tax=Methylopila capsulata TaxID=61654 RepID=A0A9W6MQX7_9HYPH|nr:SDR family oxidoreductase [Methylopila capsulata]MBM7851422.1 NAD(P)-dependent dehydrogenase (short-subunit alcohol dehydrogenase family) [Methylopila capsulata]GLK54479.1 dehydrogenase [Methylopila capsulata]